MKSAALGQSSRSPTNNQNSWGETLVTSAGEVAGRRRDGFGLADAEGEAAIERAQSGLRAPESHRGESKDDGGTGGADPGRRSS